MLIMAMTVQAQKEVYTLSDWYLKDWDAQKGELTLNVSEYKLDFNHPLPYLDMQAEWRVKAELKCGILGTEQVFVCKEGKASHLIGRNSLNGDISLGYDNTEGPWTYRGFVSTSANHGFTIHPSVIQFKGKWYYIYHDGSYALNDAPGGDCRRSVCAEYLHFNSDGTIKFVSLTQEGLSK